MRRIGVLMGIAADDPAWQVPLAAFVQGLHQMGWTEGRNVRIDYPLGRGGRRAHSQTCRGISRACPRCHPGPSSAPVALLLRETRSIPIVFTIVVDPVGAGFVDNLARPGGNVTGFTNWEYSIGGKWLELLKEIAPGRHGWRSFGLRHGGGAGQFGAIQAVAPSRGVELRPVDVRDPGEIERAITAFAQGSNGGLIVTGSAPAAVHRKLIIALAARHKLPAIYANRYFVADGGLLSYGPDLSTSSGARPATSIASSRARSQPTCRCRRQPSTSW